MFFKIRLFKRQQHGLFATWSLTLKGTLHHSFYWHQLLFHFTVSHRAAPIGDLPPKWNVLEGSVFYCESQGLVVLLPELWACSVAFTGTFNHSQFRFCNFIATFLWKATLVFDSVRNVDVYIVCIVCICKIKCKSKRLWQKPHVIVQLCSRAPLLVLLEFSPICSPCITRVTVWQVYPIFSRQSHSVRLRVWHPFGLAHILFIILHLLQLLRYYTQKPQTLSKDLLKPLLLAEKAIPVLLVFLGKQIQYFRNLMPSLNRTVLLVFFSLEIRGYSENSWGFGSKYPGLKTTATTII